MVVYVSICIPIIYLRGLDFVKWLIGALNEARVGRRLGSDLKLSNAKYDSLKLCL